VTCDFMDIQKEHRLVELAKTNANAFAILYDFYYPKISNYILHRVGDIQVAQDITSVVFLKTWVSLPKFKWKGYPFSAWLYRIANNEVNTYFRHSKKTPLSLEKLFEDCQFECPSSQDIEREYLEIEDKMSRHRDYLQVRYLILNLPIKYQEILILRYFEKKSLNEISVITGKKMNTIKSLLSRGTLKLRSEFITLNKSNG